MQNEHTALVAPSNRERAGWLGKRSPAHGYMADHATGEREIPIKAHRLRPDRAIVGPLKRHTGHLKLIGRIRAGNPAREGVDRTLRLICEELIA